MVQGDTFEPDFVDSMGDKWQEYVVYHHGFSEWMRITGKTNVEDSPYWKSTSNDVDWLMSVELQAAAQKWIDHGISKTCNLPNDVSKQTISDAYLKAWKLGCKGFTVYRDGSRSGVLVSVDEKKKETAQTVSAEKRKKELPCDIHRVTIKGESWLVLVGMNEKVPYEVFCGIADNIEVPKKIKNGTIIKNGKKDGVTTYNLRVPIGDDDEILFKDIVNLFANPTQGALTRTISLALRHSIPIQFIVEQIQKEKDMFSFSKSLARVLKTYIPDGTKAANGEDCPECNSKLLYQEGCKTCVNCGWSKCS
jgi:ribonucleoside-diphosphate reductase alpha chain